MDTRFFLTDEKGEKLKRGGKTQLSRATDSFLHHTDAVLSPAAEPVFSSPCLPRIYPTFQWNRGTNTTHYVYTITHDAALEVESSHYPHVLGINTPHTARISVTVRQKEHGREIPLVVHDRRPVR